MAEPMDIVDGPADVEEMDASVQSGSGADQGIEDFEITGFAQGEFTYQLARFKEQAQEGKPVNSKEFEIAGYSWGLLVYPGGNTQTRSAGAPMKHISVYLDCPEASVLPHQLMPRADFTLTVINHLDPANNIKKDTSHRFTQKEVDWGFTQFMPLADALDETKGFLVNDTITVKVEIKVQLDEKFTGATRKTTGFVGLKNQGATCYMNSLLQMLFHMPRFRQAVYHMPTAEDEDPRSSISLALQSLFFRLQYSHTPVSTKDLIQSFGWKTMDAFQQHDVEELELKLCEKLEEKMKGTKVDKTINRLLKGKFFNYFECKHVDYTSTRTEDFLDIQLDIMGCRDVYQSFDKIVEVETMEGENKCHAEGHGLQDARKGVLLESLPPILQLHLKRFDYDRQTWMPIKVNDRYEFYEELDLDREDGKYLSKNCDRSIRNLYKLHSVLVHSGGSHGGHYYAYIRPDGKQFYKFDDEAVTKEDNSAAIEGQFGGEDEPVQPLNQMGAPMRMKMKNVSNAYMLVYVRASDWDFVMCDAGAHHLMEHVSKRLKAEQADKERKRREKLQAHRFVTIRVVTDEDIEAHIRSETFDLVKLEDLCSEHTLKVPKTDTWEQVAAQIEAITGVPADAQLFWRWHMRENNTWRPEEPFEVKDPKEAIKFKHRALVKRPGEYPRTAQMSPMKATTLQPIDLYVTRRERSSLQNHVLLFIKIYHPQQKTITYWKSMAVPLTTLMAQLARHIQDRWFPGLEHEDAVDLYEEVRTDTCRIESIDLRDNPQTMKSQHGDVIVAQPRLSPEERERCEFPTVLEYLTHLHSLRRINFLPMGESASASSILLEVPKDADYATVVQQLAHAIKCPNPDLLCLTLHNAYTNLPQLHHVKYNEPFVGTTCASAASVQTVYYEVLDMPLPQVEQLKTMSVTVVKESMELFKTSSFRVPKESTIQYLLDLVRKDLDPGFAGGRPLRLVKVLDGRIYDVLAPDETIVDLNSSYWELRAEPIPDDDSQAIAEAGDSVRRLTVSHVVFEKSQPQHYGDPLVVMVRPTETLSSLKARLIKRLKVAPEEFATWKWCAVSPHNVEELFENGMPVLEVWDRATHAASSAVETCYIGMHHQSKNFRRPPRQSHIAATEAQIKLL